MKYDFFGLINFEKKSLVHFKVLLGFKWKCIGVQLRVQQGSFDALSNESSCTQLNPDTFSFESQKHFEMNPGFIFRVEKPKQNKVEFFLG